ncbi:hypothetical protein B5F34_02990 [Mediterranea sp. An20]|uniref:DUF7688 family protein n=1 Tax=Mediterranea sp. An20 TaxID=1965586 RepID=UPI000B39EC97|nr:hypothetical protein [Mediterranea sp. An20]OUP11482.1 hypothetical protein B5F34_02990 [Mediterranea sp. An20]
MTEEIRQDGSTILSSTSEHAIPMIFNNLCGKNFSGKEYRDYIRNVAPEMGFRPGRIELYRDGRLLKCGDIPKL